MAVNMKAISPSEATSGELIKVSSIATAGANLIHTAQAGTGDNNFDEVWLYATNTSTSDVELTLEWGDSSHIIAQNIPARQGFALVIPGMRLNNAKTIKAFATVTNVINVKCDINRIVVEADA